MVGPIQRNWVIEKDNSKIEVEFKLILTHTI